MEQTWVRVWCRREDQAAIESGTDLSIDDEGDDGASSWVILSTETSRPWVVKDDMVASGKPFFLAHGRGANEVEEYDALEVASDGNVVSERKCSVNEGYLISYENRVNDLRALEKHVAMKQQVLGLIGMDPHDLAK
ncbi:hypothetical protein ACFPN2_28320 [Steroidobacter flavus]|uniref:Uncharacterized protein n=1 Tax=Steroidobacter flavus TaxID=1842136 RepID=A0ABV8T0Z6_9GAMM